GLVATAARPDSPGKMEIETGDDFLLNSETALNKASFQGLLPLNSPLANIKSVVVEIYRVFPNDSQDPPSGQVPTRDNSPSDVAFDSRESGGGGLSFSSSLVQSTFTAANSVLNGIHPKPNQTTHGEGPVTGEEVRIDVTLTQPFSLPADHYFFVPQVELS